MADGSVPKPIREQIDEHLDSHGEAALRFAKGRLREAVPEMVRRVQGDPRYREDVFALLLEAACHERLRKLVQRHNKAIWHENSEDLHAKNGDRLRSAAGLARRLKLMDYALMGGLPLGDATKHDLLRNYEFQDRQATRMAQTAKWLWMIAGQLEDDKTLVRNALTEDELGELKARAQASI